MMGTKCSHSQTPSPPPALSWLPFLWEDLVGAPRQPWEEAEEAPDCVETGLELVTCWVGLTLVAHAGDVQMLVVDSCPPPQHPLHIPIEPVTSSQAPSNWGVRGSQQWGGVRGAGGQEHRHVVS